MTNLPCKTTGIPDPTGELAAQLTEKYLGDAIMGNFTSMTPGLTDVISAFLMVLSISFII